MSTPRAFRAALLIGAVGLGLSGCVAYDPYPSYGAYYPYYGADYGPGPYAYGPAPSVDIGVGFGPGFHRGGWHGWRR